MLKKDRLPKDVSFNQTEMKDEHRWGSYGAHDPAIIKDNDYYYVFSTDTGGKDSFKPGLQIRKSRDLINWEFVGRALKGGVPKGAQAWTGAKGLWAPEVVKMNNRYYLYYAASQFGKTQSYIGVATSDQIEGPYQDEGLVYKSVEGEPGPNAIDPNITFTPDGRVFLVFGSFFDGLYVSEVNRETGKFIEAGPGTLIARRGKAADRAIEGPYIMYHPVFEYYYLFVSYDSLFSNYNIRVARSKSITGPYLDYNGLEMTDINTDHFQVGMKLLGGYRFEQSDGWVAPGHNSILKDDQEYYICHHIREAENKHHHYLHIRKVLWSDEGWPLISPERFAGEGNATVRAKELLGEWELIDIDPNNNEQDLSYRIHATEPKDRSYFIDKKTNNTCKFKVNDQVLDGVVSVGWDWENWKETIVFAGYNHEGHVTVGKRIGD